MDAVFLPTDTPADVLGRVRARAELGGGPPDAETEPLVVGKLRLAGVYDDRQQGFFMLRTRIPGGRLGVDQAEAVARVAQEFSVRPADEEAPERFLEITTRQDFQLHWIRFEDLPAIWDLYDAVGLTTLEACGDTLRNVTACPVSGLSPYEILDAGPAVSALTAFALGEPELAAALPRKFKVVVTGCPTDCVLALLNDLAFTPARSGGALGFNVHAGGGLSDSPRLASPLDLFVLPGQVTDTVRAALRLYQDRGDFEHKAVNRFRMLVEELGPEEIAGEVRERLPFETPAAGEDLSTWATEDHLGVRGERRRGRVSVGLNVPLGRLAAAELAELARLGRTYGSGELRLTHRQNVILAGVGEERLDDLLAEPLLGRLRPDPDPFERAVVACTSAPFCKFGILDVKQKGAELVELLRQTVPPSTWGGLAGLRLHLTGCKASCGQVHAGHIGLRAAIGRDETSQHGAFDIALGGDVGAGRLARWAAAEIPVERAFAEVAAMVEAAAADPRGPAALDDLALTPGLGEET